MSQGVRTTKGPTKVPLDSNSDQCPGDLSQSGKFKRVGVFVWSFLVFAAVAFPQARSEQVTFSGTVRYEVLPDGGKVLDRQLTFQAVALDKGWQITTSETVSNGIRTYTSHFNEEHLFKGADFSKLNLTPSPPKESLQKGHTIKTNFITQNYKAYPGEAIPAYSMDLSFPLWIAFFSRDYFVKHAETGMPDFTSMSSGAILPGEPALEIVSSLDSSTSNSVPREIIFKCLGFYQDRDESGAVTQHPYPKGVVRARFAIKEWGYLDGQRYPASAILEVYGPKPGAKTNSELRTVTRATIKSTILTTSQEPQQPTPRKDAPFY